MGVIVGKWMIVVAFVALPGCGNYMTPERYEAAHTYCKPHGGLKWIPPQWSRVEVVRVACHDRSEATVQIRKPAQ